MRSASTRTVALPIGPRTAAVLVLASLAGLMMLCWPLLLRVHDTTRVDPPFLFLGLLPVVLAGVLAELNEGGLDPRVLAILGVLSAANAILRGVSPGTAGVELTFFLLILAGRVFGPGFGFVLGCTSLFASALMTAGVGPWLPYQMLCAAWVGMGAGLLPRSVTGRGEIAMLGKLYSGQRAADVVDFDVESFFRRIGLESFLTQQRRTGLGSMVKRIREQAAQIAAGEAK